MTDETTPPAATSPDTGAVPTGADEVTEDLVKLALRGVKDPELNLNIVDLGLVYECNVTPLERGGHRVSVKFTLTAPGCGMGDFLKRDIETKIAELPGVSEAEVEVVLEPVWDQSRMSDVARLQLGLM